MRKRLALALVLPMLAALVCGCAGKAPGEAQTPRASLTALQFELDNQAIDFANLWFFDELERRTNVHVDFDEVKESDWVTKLNLMFASGNYRDMILRGSLDVEEYGVSQGLLIPLQDGIREYMPHYASRLALQDVGEKMLSSDGSTYYIGFMISQGVNTNGPFFINRQWLDALGLSVPKTVDELTAVLRAFRDGDPNKNGIKDEIPWEATFDDTNTGIYNAFAFWGVPMNDYFICVDENGTVYCPALRDGYRECAEWLHTLYADKLLDMECITQSSNVWATKINQSTAGFFTYWRLTNTTLKPEVAEQYECMLPVSAEGRSARVSRITDAIDFGAALTVTNPNVPASLRWLDAQFETETMMISQNGALGDMLTIDESGRYTVKRIPPDNELYSMVPVICGQFFAPSGYYEKVYTPAEHRLEKRRYSELYEQAGVLEPISFQELTTSGYQSEDESKRIQDCKSALKSVINEWLVSFITQGVSDESWEEYSAALIDAGAYEYVALYQGIYDRRVGGLK